MRIGVNIFVVDMPGTNIVIELTRKFGKFALSDLKLIRGQYVLTFIRTMTLKVIGAFGENDSSEHK